jgi:hypothetical protein
MLILVETRASLLAPAGSTLSSQLATEAGVSLSIVRRLERGSRASDAVVEQPADFLKRELERSSYAA